MARRSGVRWKLFSGLIFALVLSTYTMYFAYTSPGKVSEYWFTAMAMRGSISGHTRVAGHTITRFGLQSKTQNVSESSVYLSSRSSDICPESSPTLKGPLSVNTSVVEMVEVERRLLERGHHFAPGGHWSPSDCTPRWRVAIVIPFRNRHEHLPILLRHLIPMLQRQRLQFGFYVVEQTGREPFNRAMLFNVGFLEAMKDKAWDCMIFHDVDHIPENDLNYYGCRDMPRHYSVLLDKYYYALPYEEFFGGVSGLKVDHIHRMNGFANGFWGWGGEDDDMWNR